MSAIGGTRQSSFNDKEGDTDLQATNLADLMSQDGSSQEKSERPGLAAHEDARAIVRLIQCAQCSRPLRTPVTLPCGNSLCRQCLPEAHERTYISYPDLPGRKQALHCPFPECGREHPAADCGIDVTLTKVMESVADIVTRHLSAISTISTIMEEVSTDLQEDVRWDEAVGMDRTNEKEILSEKPRMYELAGGRLIATYTLAAQCLLPYNTDLYYQSGTDQDGKGGALDVHVLQDLLESTQREVDCQLCYNLMFDPVTTYCGHTLCRVCMTRVMDHGLQCPVCRRQHAIPPSVSMQSSNKALSNLLDALCPEAVAARAEAVAAEELGMHGDQTVPLFVCTLAFPGQPTFLRIFEPRYRLMLRRCLAGNKEFGMLIYNQYREPQGDLGPIHFYHYGTMLRILNHQPLADGTSLVETRGAYRFRVKSHDILDGYAVGTVERLEDVSLAEEERIEAEETTMPAPEDATDVEAQINRTSTRDLLTKGLEFVAKMQVRHTPWMQRRMLDLHGEPPNDPALFPYWFASLVPINEGEKYKLLGTRTVRERLKITAMWIQRIESQRWSSRYELQEEEEEEEETDNESGTTAAPAESYD